jgi:hypothetical protein
MPLLACLQAPRQPTRPQLCCCSSSLVENNSAQCVCLSLQTHRPVAAAPEQDRPTRLRVEPVQSCIRPRYSRTTTLGNCIIWRTPSKMPGNSVLVRKWHQCHRSVSQSSNNIAVQYWKMLVPFSTTGINNLKGSPHRLSLRECGTAYPLVSRAVQRGRHRLTVPPWHSKGLCGVAIILA